MRGVGRIKAAGAYLRGLFRPASPSGQISKKAIARHLPRSPVIVEAGAHTGVDTVELARRWPKGVVHAFEPVPALFDQLESRTRDLANVRRSRLALSDRAGKQVLHLSEGASDGSSSLLPPERHLDVHPEVRFEKTIDVDTVTLDGWAEQQGIGRIDFLWLDMQGMEPAVLRASPRMLAGVRAVHTEVSLMPVYARSVLYPEFRAWMETQGFVVAEEALPYPDMGNVLFVRRS